MCFLLCDCTTREGSPSVSSPPKPISGSSWNHHLMFTGIDGFDISCRWSGISWLRGSKRLRSLRKWFIGHRKSAEIKRDGRAANSNQGPGAGWGLSNLSHQQDPCHCCRCFLIGRRERERARERERERETEREVRRLRRETGLKGPAGHQRARPEPITQGEDRRPSSDGGSLQHWLHCWEWVPIEAHGDYSAVLSSELERGQWDRAEEQQDVAAEEEKASELKAWRKKKKWGIDFLWERRFAPKIESNIILNPVAGPEWENKACESILPPSFSSFFNNFRARTAAAENYSLWDNWKNIGTQMLLWRRDTHYSWDVV